MQCTGTFSANFLLSNPLPCNSVVFQPLGVKVISTYTGLTVAYIYIFPILGIKVKAASVNYEIMPHNYSTCFLKCELQLKSSF